MLKKSVLVLALGISIYMLWGPVYADLTQADQVTLENWAKERKKLWSEKYGDANKYFAEPSFPQNDPRSYLLNAINQQEVKTLGQLLDVYISFADHARLEIIRKPEDHRLHESYTAVLSSELTAFLDLVEVELNTENQEIHKSLYNAIEAATSRKASQLQSELYMIRLQLQGIAHHPNTVLTSLDAP